jgi:hypothetical protein
MKRSSHRRAIRWILQELTRCLDQHNKTDLSLDDKPVVTRRSHVTDGVPE